MPKYTIIVAMDSNMLIGSQNQMPWRIPEDLAYFRNQTLGHNVIMGHKTWLSLGKSLDQRTNIVLTRNPNFTYPGLVVHHSIDELKQWLAAQACEGTEEQQNFVIGGAQVFAQFLPLANRLYITKIHHEFKGDTFFPNYNDKDWELVSYDKKGTASGLEISFNQYVRKGETHAQLG